MHTLFAEFLHNGGRYILFRKKLFFSHPTDCRKPGISFSGRLAIVPSYFDL